MQFETLTCPLILYEDMLNLCQSNHFEELLTLLYKNLDTRRLKNPMTAVDIVVPSIAVKRKITLALADHYGICANVNFKFLAKWIVERIRGFSDKRHDISPFETKSLLWRIMYLLKEGRGEKPFSQQLEQFPRLKSYLSRCDDVMLYEFSHRLASLYNRYQLLRPQMLQVWSRDNAQYRFRSEKAKEGSSIRDDEKWQSALWKQIVDTTLKQSSNPLGGLDELGIAVESHGIKVPATWHQEVHIFCEDTLSTENIAILQILCKYIDIKLYLLNPCREYWFEIEDRKRLAWLKAHNRDTYHEAGNPLLASWGKQTKVLIEKILVDMDSFDKQEERFIEPSGPNNTETLLSCLQKSILNLQDLKASSLAHPGADGSIEIHIAHSMQREVEILHDQMLRRFAADKTLEPADMLVLVPDIDVAAPFIDTVFGHAGGKSQIPYLITGRNEAQVNPVARALLEIIALGTSRFTASAVMNALSLPEIAGRFGLENDAETIMQWLEDANICWAFNGSHKTSFDLPEDDAYTFHDGINRLYLAYAMPDTVNYPIDGRLPAGHVSGTRSLALGKLFSFIEKMKELSTTLASAHTPTEWRDCWLNILDTFIKTSAQNIEYESLVRKIISTLRKNMTVTFFHDKKDSDEWLRDESDDADIEMESVEFRIEPGAACAALKRELENTGYASTLSGHVTFTSIGDLRGLPYKHIFVLGLNDGAFPVDRRADEFDLIQACPEEKDISSREVDRNVFLDLILAARNGLYFSYSGRDVRDNQERPESVLLAELTGVLSEAIATGTSSEEKEKARKSLEFVHPLQPFSEKYFNGTLASQMPSYRQDLCAAISNREETLQTTPTDLPAISDAEEEEEGFSGATRSPFFTGNPTESDDSNRTITLQNLVDFFRNPSDYLLKNQLGIGFPDEIRDLPVNEPFVPDRFTTEHLGRFLIPKILEGETKNQLMEYARAFNEYPQNPIGRMGLEREVDSIRKFTESLPKEQLAEKTEPVHGDLALTVENETWLLTGSLSDTCQNGLIRYAYGQANATTILDGWISHLFLNACSPKHVGHSSTWYFRDETITLRPVDNAKERLAELLAIYREGLKKPVHFYPKSAYTFMDKKEKLSEAEKKWKEGEFSESRKEAYRLALRGVGNPLDEKFTELAKRVFAPYFEHIEARHDK